LSSSISTITSLGLTYKAAYQTFISWTRNQNNE